MQEILVFLQNHWILSTLLVIVLILLFMIEYLRIQKGMHTQSPSEVTQLINHQNATVVDIRSTESYTSGHITGAISIPFSELSNQLKKIEKFKTQPLVLVCATGAESTQALNLLIKNGFQQVYLLEGGIRAWKLAEMPLVKE